MPDTLFVYDEIGGPFGITADAFARELKAAGNDVEVRINSGGGSVFEGIGIYNQILDARIAGRKVSTIIDGAALSAASVIAVAGNPVVMSDAALIMIHLPYAPVGGNATELRKTAETLDKVSDQLVRIYHKRTKKPETKIRSWLEAETWFDVDEALSVGLVDRRQSEVPQNARASALLAVTNSGYKIPARYVAKIRSPIDEALVSFERKVNFARTAPTMEMAQSIERDVARIAEQITKMPGRTSDDLAIVCSGLDRLPRKFHYYGMDIRGY